MLVNGTQEYEKELYPISNWGLFQTFKVGSICE